jgi:uncharacterized protein (TIRG00374 family)
MFIPITAITAWRLQILIPNNIKLGFLEANKFILLGSVFNIILPSNMGTIAKSYFIQQKGYLDTSLSLSLVIFEKTCDLLSLLLWCLFGLIFYPQTNKPSWLGLIMLIIITGIILFSLLLISPRFFRTFILLIAKIAPKNIFKKLQKFSKSWHNLHKYLWSNTDKLLSIGIISLLIWFINLCQIWLFTLALNSSVPFLANLALSPLSILVGLLPITFSGIGTRDAALIFFYQPYLPQVAAVGLGLLCTSRYVLPALAGLPLLDSYLFNLRKINNYDKF